MTPDEQIAELSEQVVYLQAQLSDAQAELRGIRDDAGTPLAISDGLWKFAEEECGHNPLSARPALLTVIDWVQKAKVELADARAELAEARLDTERMNKLCQISIQDAHSFRIIVPLWFDGGDTDPDLRKSIDAARKREEPKCQSKSGISAVSAGPSTLEQPPFGTMTLFEQAQELLKKYALPSYPGVSFDSAIATIRQADRTARLETLEWVQTLHAHFGGLVFDGEIARRLREIKDAG